MKSSFSPSSCMLQGLNSGHQPVLYRLSPLDGPTCLVLLLFFQCLTYVCGEHVCVFTCCGCVSMRDVCTHVCGGLRPVLFCPQSFSTLLTGPRRTRRLLFLLISLAGLFQGFLVSASCAGITVELSCLPGSHTAGPHTFCSKCFTI